MRKALPWAVTLLIAVPSVAVLGLVLVPWIAALYAYGFPGLALLAIALLVGLLYAVYATVALVWSKGGEPSPPPPQGKPPPPDQSGGAA